MRSEFGAIQDELTIFSQKDRVIVKEMASTKTRTYQPQQNLVPSPLLTLPSFLYCRYLAGKVDLLTNEHRLVMIIHLLRGDKNSDVDQFDVFEIVFI